MDKSQRHNGDLSYSLFSRRNTFHDFLNKSQNFTEDGKYFFFIKHELIVNKNLQNDYIKPSFLTKILKNRIIALTMWQDYLRKPEFKEKERYFCVIDGVESFKMVSPVFK